MMADGKSSLENPMAIVPRPARDIVPRLARQLGTQLKYRRYALRPDPDWTSYAAQRHVRDIAFDKQRNQIWMATWGGVLCLSLDVGLCTRHTSEHGLVGNAIRCIALDDDGVVW